MERSHAYEVWLQRMDEVSYERCREKKNEVEMAVLDAKINVDEW